MQGLGSDGRWYDAELTRQPDGEDGRRVWLAHVSAEVPMASPAQARIAKLPGGTAVEFDWIVRDRPA